MDDLRKLSMQFVMHKSMSTQEFALGFVQFVALNGDDERMMLTIAELFLNARPTGEG